MTNLKKFVIPVAIMCCLLILAFSSILVVKGQKGQLPDKRRGGGDDYVIIDGDMQVSRDFYERLQAEARSPQSPPVWPGTKLWPGGIVPFEFDRNVSEENRTKMIDAMAVLEGAANVDFRRCDFDDCEDGDYVHIRDSDEIPIPVGVMGGKQYLNNFNWDSKFIMAHELMHCLGFLHEDNKSNRDDYIWINCDNVIGGCGENSRIGSKPWKNIGNGHYDYDSVLHYDQCAFSKNSSCPSTSAEFPDGGVTIVVLPPNGPEWQNKIGQRDHLSEMDRVNLSFVYPYPDWRFFDGGYPRPSSTSNGSFFRPYKNFAEAVANTPEGGTLWLLRTETIPAVGTYGKRITIKVAPRVAAILGN